MTTFKAKTDLKNEKNIEIFKGNLQVLCDKYDMIFQEGEQDTIEELNTLLEQIKNGGQPKQVIERLRNRLIRKNKE